MHTVTKWATFVLGILLWGFLISIGFWLGHQLTDRIDLWIKTRREDRDGAEAFQAAAADLASDNKQ